MQPTIFDIQRGSFVDGPGIRTTVFFKGCDLRCKWCHNPESQRSVPERLWYESKCSHCEKCVRVCPAGAISSDLTVNTDKCTLCGECADHCPNDAISICGRAMSDDEIFAEIAKDKTFYESSGGGVTFSGGECLLYPDVIESLCKRCRKAQISTAVDTAGAVSTQIIERIANVCDIFLYDIKCVTPELHKRFTGLDNSLILTNYKRLISLGCKVIVRVPMVVECNANDSEFPKIAELLNEFKPYRVELLPYHRMGENKFRALHHTEPEAFTAPTKSDLERFKAMLDEKIRE